jgi:hypothetical protein
VPERAHSDADLEAAVQAMAEPERLREAQDLVARAMPSLQRVLNAALADGGWFGEAHEQALRAATQTDDPEGRARAVRTLVAEETRLGMLVGVAVGYELARELAAPTHEAPTNKED